MNYQQIIFTIYNNYIYIYLIFLQQQPIQMKPKTVKKTTETKPKKEKCQSKRMKTFNSSEFSMWEQKQKEMQASATELTILKNQYAHRRAQNNSALSQYGSTKSNTTKIPIAKKKKVAPKNKLKVKKFEQQQFEKIKYKQSNSQSQIVFSNDQTKRQSAILGKDLKNLPSLNNYLPDSNLVLRINIKKQYMRKVQAATKIQKVFRGYMTRKILMKYINQEQVKLKKQIVPENQSLDFDQIRQNQTHRTFVDNQGENLLNRLFQNRIAGDNFNHTIRPRTQDLQSSQNQQVKILQKKQHLINKKNLFLDRKEQKNKIKRNNWMQNEEIQSFNNQQQNQSEQQSSEDEDDKNNMIYRRQNPIYSQQQISQYLESSQEDQQEQQLDQYQPQIIFETNQEYIQSRKSSLQSKNDGMLNKLSNKGLSDLTLIISGQDKIRKQLRQNQPKLQLSKKKQDNQMDKQQKIQTKPSIEKIQQTQTTYDKKDQVIKKIAQPLNLQQHKQQQDKQKQRQQQQHIQQQHKQQQRQQLHIQQQRQQQCQKRKKKQKQICQTIEVNLDQYSQKSQKKSKRNTKGKQKQQLTKSQSLNLEKQQKNINPYSPRREVKYLDQQQFISNQSQNNSSRGSKSKASAQKRQIAKLRQQECQKWEQVINMVSQQIKKNNENNGQMVSFMKNIMEFSQKNKQLLASIGSTRSINSQSQTFTTPTSMGMGVYRSIQVKEGSKSVSISKSAQKQQESNLRIQQNQANKFFKKKKPLKIDIVDSNFLKQERESLINNEKSDKKFLKPTKFNFSNQKQFIKGYIKNKQQVKQSFADLYLRNDKIVVESRGSKNYESDQSSDKPNPLKKFLANNIQVQDEAVSNILKLRQQLLQKRQSQQLIKLNNQLSHKQLTQQKFLQKLTNLTKKFMQQKKAIDKAKLDICKGYQAANNLVKQYFFDVRRMGIKLALSKSQDNLKYKISQPLNYFNQFQVDELTPKSTPKSGRKISVKQIFAQHQITTEQINKQKSPNHHPNSIQSSDSSLDFTQQQLKRFRKAANYDLQFNDLNRNMTTTNDEFIKQQKKSFYQQSQSVTAFNESPDNKFSRNILPQSQTYLLEQSKAPSTRTPPHIQALVDCQINLLMWQFTGQLILKPEISQKFLQKPTLTRPVQISMQERFDFIKILQQNLPDKNILYKKLNQNITPLPSEILKCMRLDFSEQPQQEQQDDNLQQINRYEFVIGQQSCAKSVMLFKNNLDQIKQRIQIDELKKNYQINKKFQQSNINMPQIQKIQKFINQRQKFVKNKKQHTRQLRWQVMNIQLHCIFDSWNEQIIQICSGRPGFSGIGLNQLTLSMINHNKSIPEYKSQAIITQAKNKVIEIITDQSDINTKILKQNFHQMCQNDSAWVFYADQALSYALELVYLVQQEIYSQISKQLRRIIVKNSLTL